MDKYDDNGNRLLDFDEFVRMVLAESKALKLTELPKAKQVAIAIGSPGPEPPPNLTSPLTRLPS